MFLSFHLTESSWGSVSGGKAFQYRVLPFGLTLSPCTFTKCMDAALAPLKLQRIRVLNYIDDWLKLAQSREMAVRHRDVVLGHIWSLGLRLNTKKSVLSPAQRATSLGGVVWDSKTMWAQLSPARIKSILAVVSRLKLGHAITVKEFHRLLGFSYNQGMPSCPVHMEETLVSVPRPSIGSVMSPKSLLDRLIPYGLVRGHRTAALREVCGGPSIPHGT